MSNKWGTWLLFGVCLALFLAARLVGESTTGFSLTSGHNSRVLFQMGACFAPAVWSGDFWRLVGAIFLHVSLMHVTVNLLCLWIWGPRLERYLGTWAYLSLAALSGIAGTLLSAGLGPTRVAVGFSGVLCGFLGALAWLSRASGPLPADERADLSRYMIPLALATLVTGWFTPGVDNFAHLGGLLGGVAAAAWLEKKPPLPLLRVLALLPFLIELFVIYRAVRPTPLSAWPTWTWSSPRLQVELPILFRPTADYPNAVYGPGLLLQIGSRPAQSKIFTSPPDVHRLDLAKVLAAELKTTVDNEESVNLDVREWLLLHYAAGTDLTAGEFAFASAGRELITLRLSSPDGGTGLRQILRGLLSGAHPVLTATDRAIEALNEKTPDAALSGYDQALKENPRDVTALASRGALRMHLGELDEAADDFHRWLLLEPGAQPFLLWAQTVRGQAPAKILAALPELPQAESFTVKLALAEIFSDHKEPQAAAELLRSLEKPGLSPSQTTLLYNSMAWLGANRGDWGQALRDVDVALKQPPQDISRQSLSAVYDTRGFIQLGRKRPKEAIVDLQRAIQLDPNARPMIWEHLGKALEAAHQTGPAIECYRRILMVEPGNREAQKALERLKAR